MLIRPHSRLNHRHFSQICINDAVLCSVFGRCNLTASTVTAAHHRVRAVDVFWWWRKQVLDRGPSQCDLKSEADGSSLNSACRVCRFWKSCKLVSPDDSHMWYQDFRSNNELVRPPAYLCARARFHRIYSTVLQVLPRPRWVPHRRLPCTKGQAGAVWMADQLNQLA